MMISADTVDSVVERISTMSTDQAKALVMKMSKEQPMVLAYLLAMSENEAFDQDEGQTFLFIGIAVWQIMKAGVKGLKKISEERINRVEEDNEDLLDKMASDSPGDFVSAAESMVENYPEPELLRYVTTALMEDEDADNPPIRSENLGIAFLHLKIVLDAFVGLPK